MSRNEEDRRQAHTAFIPSANQALAGLGKVNGDPSASSGQVLVAFVQSRSPQSEATLDMDACLVETEKQEALYCYNKYKAYQPLTTYWAEAELIIHSEFQDGNVGAGHEQLRVLKEALGHMPPGVKKVLMRSDTAGYQKELLKYCAEGKDERFGVIEFAVGVDVTPEFKKAVAQVAEEDWQTLEREVDGHKTPTGQQWAEVCFVPNWIGHSKKSPDYRFIAIRELLEPVALPGTEEQLSLSFPTMELADKGCYKVSGVVTNRDLAGDKLNWWYRQRCGKREQAHGVMKDDLAAGKLPSGLFGVNAAWWAIAVLAFNLNSAMKRLVLGKEWVKAVRFALISLAGWVVRRARTLINRLTRGHSSYGVLLRARQRILALAHSPTVACVKSKHYTHHSR